MYTDFSHYHSATLNPYPIVYLVIVSKAMFTFHSSMEYRTRVSCIGKIATNKRDSKQYSNSSWEPHSINFGPFVKNKVFQTNIMLKRKCKLKFKNSMDKMKNQYVNIGEMEENSSQISPNWLKPENSSPDNQQYFLMSFTTFHCFRISLLPHNFSNSRNSERSFRILTNNRN